jgi:AcrR family transcriptional regulator
MSRPSSRRAAAPAAATREADGPADARERLLQAAIEILATRGDRGFKVLEVARRAGSNVALINYHFGSRAGLVAEALRCTGVALAQARAERLEALLAAAGTAAPALPALVRCWLEPVFDSVYRQDRASLLMLTAHLAFAAELDAQAKEHMVRDILAVDRRFVDALAHCLPALSRSAIAWRLAAAVGSYCFVLGQREATSWRASAGGHTPDLAEAYEELVAFVIGGLTAPPAG